jgi:hypothetical protein
VSESDRIAPEGKIWVCLACGKVAEDKYGCEGFVTKGWDVSCSLNSGLVDRHRLVYGTNGLVIEVLDL